MERKSRQGQRLICGLTAVVMLFLLQGCVQKNADGSVPMTEREIGQYGQYIPTIPGEDTAEDVTELWLESCIFVKTEEIAGQQWDIYYPDDIARYLYGAKNINSVEKTGDILYISFTTIIDYNVTLTYNAEGFVRMDLYDEEKDTVYSMTKDHNVKYKTNSI